MAEKGTWDYIIEDIQKRNAVGIEKYGVELNPTTNQNMMLHLYEELLDAVVYIKTEILRQNLTEHVPFEVLTPEETSVTMCSRSSAYMCPYREQETGECKFNEMCVYQEK